MSRGEPLLRLTRRDFEVTWFRGSGGGGQHRNKHANCCRIRHPASGVSATGQSSRSREQNKRDAFRALRSHPTFVAWYNRKIAEALDGETIAERVERDMRLENLRTEVMTPDGWKEIDE